MNKLIIPSCILLCNCFLVFGQSSVTSTTQISATIVQGLSVTHEDKTSLNYGEIILSGQGVTAAINPSNGTELLVAGHPEKNVTISFSPSILSNEMWAKQNGGSKSSLIFTPEMVHTGNHNLYTNPSKIISGNSYKLVKVKNDGRLYLWVGGSIQVDKSQAQGDYEGIFTVNVSY